MNQERTSGAPDPDDELLTDNDGAAAGEEPDADEELPDIVLDGVDE